MIRKSQQTVKTIDEKKTDKIKLKNIEKIKNHSVEVIGKVHALAFLLFELAVYIGLERIVLSKLLEGHAWVDTVWCELIRYVFFAGGYLFFFWLSKKFLNWLIVKQRPQYDIEGEWYHVHIPNKLGEKESTQKPLSAGTTTIARDLNDFTFKGDNYKYIVEDGQVKQLEVVSSTTWSTETSEICDSNQFQIVEVYKAHSNKKQTTKVDECPVCKQHFRVPRDIPEASEDRYGIHLYRIELDRQRIICNYSDCWPSLKSGTLYLYKNKADRDDMIKAYFSEVKNYS